MSRRLPDGVIKNFCKFCEGLEVNPVFALWVGISIVSAAMGRNSFIDFGYFTIYPNLYIVLVGASARCKKSTVIDMGQRILKLVEPKITILSQKMTPEALIGALAGVEAVSEQAIIPRAEGIMMPDELSTLIDKNSFQTGMIQILTKLYDCTDFDYKTKSRGTEHIRNPCLSMLGGSTLHWIREAIPMTAIGGGWTSRVVFVYQEKQERMIPWPELSEDNRKRIDNMSTDLGAIQKLRGCFAVEPSAKALFSEEYKRFKQQSPMFSDPNLGGYAERRATTLLKVCMCLSASYKDSRIVSSEDMMLAMEIMRQVEQGMFLVMQAISSEPIGDVCEQVLQLIMNRRRIPRFELMRAMKHRLSVRELDTVVQTLEEIRVVRAEVTGGSVTYVYIGDKQ